MGKADDDFMDGELAASKCRLGARLEGREDRVARVQTRSTETRDDSNLVERAACVATNVHAIESKAALRNVLDGGLELGANALRAKIQLAESSRASLATSMDVASA